MWVSSVCLTRVLPRLHPESGWEEWELIQRSSLTFIIKLGVLHTILFSYATSEYFSVFMEFIFYQ